MQGFVIDILVLLLLAFMTWNGFRKGFFLTAASIVIFFAAIVIGATVANKNVDKAAGSFEGILDWVAETPTEEAMSKLGVTMRNATDQQVQVIIEEAFASLGIRSDAVGHLTEEVKDAVMSKSLTTLYETISRFFVRSLTWVVLFFAGYVVSSLLLSLIANFISTAFKLPVIKQLDLFGGLALGFVNGLLIMFLIGFALRYVGIIIPGELLDSTSVLKFFIDVNPFGSIINL